MPYQSDNKSLSMLVFLPNENSATAVDGLLQKISSKTIENALKKSGKSPQKVNVQFPRMINENKMNKNYDLSKVCCH